MRGVLAFLMIFFLMPIGHAVMILMNNLIPDHLVLGASIVFFLGIGLLVLTRFSASASWVIKV